MRNLDEVLDWLAESARRLAERSDERTPSRFVGEGASPEYVEQVAKAVDYDWATIWATRTDIVQRARSRAWRSRRRMRRPGPVAPLLAWALS